MVVLSLGSTGPILDYQCRRLIATTKSALDPLRLFVFAVAEKRVEVFGLHPADCFCDPLINIAVIGIKAASPGLAPGTLDEKLNVRSGLSLAFTGL